MVSRICVPNEVIIFLVNKNITPVVHGLSIYDFWTSIELTEEIANLIYANKLPWRYDYWSF